MTFKARFLAETPDNIEFTMKVTMTAKEWCEVRDSLEKTTSYTPNQLRYAINDLLAQARKVFYHIPESSDEASQ